MTDIRPRPDAPGSRLFHLALAADWAAAFEAGEYRVSTLGMTLDDVGYLHASHAHQVQGVADAFYRGRSDVVLLVIAPERFPGEIREDLDPASGQYFPHLYGALPVGAVVAAPAVGLAADGTLDLAALLAP
ncbi:DUF952 domain-containing protein [Demequina sp.]|uniref:DUF952 domain-containing protein n=1 Tax=Demequina sp. TaxID=2050685 RepID=UPI003D11C8D2